MPGNLESSGSDPRLFLILLLGLSLRLYHVTSPPIDFLSWRDTQTLMVARNFYEHGMNLFLPAVDWRTTSAVDACGTVGGTELMVVPWLTAILYHIFGLQYWVARVIPIFFALLGTYHFYRLVEKRYDSRAATISALLLTVSPYFLYCGRCQMPESFALAMSFAALRYYGDWLERRDNRTFVLAVCHTALMLLAKPQMGVMALPMAFLTLNASRARTFREWRLYVFAALVGLPVLAWLYWSSYVLIPRTGISFSGPGFFNYRRWLLNPEYYTSILGSVWSWSVTPPMCLLGFAGLFILPRDRRMGLAAAWLVGAASLFILMPGGTAPNGYYQIILEPPFALLAGSLLAAGLSRKYLRWGAAAALILAVAWPFSVTRVLYRQDYAGDLECGTWVRDNTPKDALVLTSSPSPAALYFSERIGWTAWQEHYGKGAVFGRELIEKTRTLGASVLAIPAACERFDNSYYADYEGVRDYLYDTYGVHKEDSFSVFLLDRAADLALAVGGRVAFGTPESRKYLRGSWGPNQVDGQGRSFVTVGPAEKAGIRFAVAENAAWASIEYASVVADQTVTVEVDGQPVGSVKAPEVGRHGEIRFAVSGSGPHTVALSCSRRNADGVSICVYALAIGTR